MDLNKIIHSVWYQPKTLDCYTIIIQQEYFPAERGYYNCIAMSEDTIKFCEFQRCVLDTHLGDPITFEKLPKLGQEKILDLLHSKEDIEYMTYQIDYNIEEKQEMYVEKIDEDGNKTLEDASGKMLNKE